MAINKKYYALGTLIDLTVYNPGDEKLLKGAYELIKEYEDKLTVNRTSSEIMNINYASGKNAVAVSEISYEIVKRAIEISQKKLGFNALIGPVVKLWHIGFVDAKIPQAEKIVSKLALTDPFSVVLEDKKRTVFLLKKGMELDLGGIAKGYIADAIKDYWISHHIDRGIINLGGNVLLVGNAMREDHLWNVGIQSPFNERNEPLGILKTGGYSVVTSGIYERFLKIDGKEYHHIFNPKTGYPVANDLASVTAVTKKSIDGEIWASLGFYNGIRGVKKQLYTRENVGMIFTTKDRKVYITENIEKNFKITNQNYSLTENSIL
ncbi:FAD:protein FMN transferase [Liquorilactobacillus mali]|uniref:FAD:protein FMN transferase n=1 Tax=Liquorilactobacillus mali KCTC 3596 = DSM 20444 TaxID=1046596 RepID=J1F3L5_9LACO|nr:FAD:protein FMN transferase [Liquorilactobacillus mali]EJE99960.1 thiamine biosynthesis membrane-associated lipoprotein [Liquorilactobacillus mali KCTC 3596 = DSM 20444]KRN11259.1 thiamine biosynthesis membrane-associated lipoprotein [Liquorilactobacillus mali KCTC 3596 = DSM 20444]QFQ73754.1 FAD:protein FMN transferase [Liquorilactobacillus mali]